jgi:hypothetical protein
MTRARIEVPPRFRGFAPLAALTLLAAPAATHAQQGEADEIVAEALFLADPLPAGGRDLSFTLALQRGEPDQATGEREVAAFPRLQFAAPIGDRFGFLADAGIRADGDGVDDLVLAFKAILREAAPGRTGFSASADFYGSFDSEVDTAAGITLGAMRPLGPVTLRASALAATAISGWSPRLHAGASAALALGSRWRVLAEVMADVTREETVFGVGPTLKVALGDGFALMAGALFELAPTPRSPVFALQLTASM